MNIRKIIKNNLFGFIIGGIVFGAITTVLATSISASSLLYTTSENNNVATVDDAVKDLYDKIYGVPIECYNGVCGKISYKYWNNNFLQPGSHYIFSKTQMPDITYDTRALLESNNSYFSGHRIYIRSVLIDGNLVGHEACFWESKNTKEFCISGGYWAGTLNVNDTTVGTNTKIKLQRELSNELGLNSSSFNCGSGNDQSYCMYGSISTSSGAYGCGANNDGGVYCAYVSNNYSINYYCEVQADGSACCSH